MTHEQIEQAIGLMEACNGTGFTITVNLPDKTTLTIAEEGFVDELKNLICQRYRQELADLRRAASGVERKETTRLPDYPNRC